MLGKDVAYIPLDITKFYFLHGSNVENYVNSVVDERLPRPGCHLRQELTVSPSSDTPRGFPRVGRMAHHV